MEYLEFELPIKELEDQLQKCQIIGKESDVDVSETSLQILQKLDIAKKEIYKKILIGCNFKCDELLIYSHKLTYNDYEFF